MENAPIVCGLCSKTSANVTCVCTDPGLALCPVCTLTHLTSAGTHIIRSGPIVALANEVCSLCRRVEAFTICCCQPDGVMLCPLCVPKHLEKGIWHQQVPIQAKAYFQTPNYFDKLKVREKSIFDGMKELEGNLLTITECEEVLLTKTELAIEDIRKYQERMRAELKAIRAMTEAALIDAKKEVAEHFYQDPYEPVSLLTQSLWNYQPGSLQLFAYTVEDKYIVRIRKELPQSKEVEEVYENKEELESSELLLQEEEFEAISQEDVSEKELEQLENVPQGEQSEDISQEDVLEKESEQLEKVSQGEQSEDISQADVEEEEQEKSQKERDLESVYAPTLYLLNSASIISYNVHTEEYSDIYLTRTIKVSVTTAYCLTDNGTLWICGGNDPCTSTVYEVNWSSGEVQARKAMLYCRAGHAVLQYKNCIYVFGGFNAYIMDKCERYVLALKSWEKRASMISPRCYFNPCSYLHYVYLFGGDNTALAEVYNIGRDVFTNILLTLPIAGPASALLVKGTTIAIVQESMVTYWDLGSSKTLADHLESPWGNACPVYWKDYIYIPQDHIQLLSA